LSNEAILQTGSLQPEDFYLDSHRIIFSRMKQMAQHNMAIDLITLMNVLSKKKEVDVVGGHAYLFSLTDGLPYRRSIESVGADREGQSDPAGHHQRLELRRRLSDERS
jgi:replicative DNA helicase